MTIHDKQSFVTGELSALLKRIDPTITGAVYTESNTKAHVVISYRDKPTEALEVSKSSLKLLAMRCLIGVEDKHGTD